MTVSAVARLMPRPPARVESRKQNAGDPTATTHRHKTASLTSYETFTYNTGLMFQCVYRTAPGHLSSDVRRVADGPGQKHLRVIVSSLLAIPATRRSSIDDRTFVIAAASVWNKLPRNQIRHIRHMCLDAGWKLTCSITFIMANYVKWLKFLKRLSL